MVGSSGGPEPTLYETLGVGEDASTAEVRAAYRERAKDTHPDVSDAPDARRRFRRVKRAHEVLSDERERRRYDRLGHEAYVSLDDPGPSENADRGGGDGRRPTDSRTTGRGSGAARTAGAAPGGTGGRRHGPSGPGGTGRWRGTTGGQAGGHGGRAAGSRGRSATGSRDRSGARTRGRSGTGTSAASTTGEGDPVGRVAYGLARWLEIAGGLVDAWQSRLGPAGAAIALATFAAYPVLLASTVTPLFPLPVNLLVGVCTFATLGYLVLRPAIGVAVLGTWLLVLPAALTVSGVGIVSLGGLYSLVVTVVPLVLCVVTLAGTSA